MGVYEMCTLKHPFDAKNQMALLAKIIQGKFTPIPDTYSVDLRGLVNDCLLHDSNLRPSITELFAKPAVAEWSAKYSLVVGTPEEEISPDAKRRWKKISAQVSRMHEDAVKDLDPPGRLVWDSMYRLL